MPCSNPFHSVRASALVLGAACALQVAWADEQAVQFVQVEQVVKTHRFVQTQQLEPLAVAQVPAGPASVSDASSPQFSTLSTPSTSLTASLPSSRPDTPSKTTSPVFNYALGALASTVPSSEGSSGRKTRLRPSVAVEYGRFRLSSSRGSAFLGHGLRAIESGASATITENDQFSLRAGLRIDRGEGAFDEPRLAGLPPVRSTLRARLSAGYAITRRWSLGTTVTQDILGRDGGAQLSTNVGYTWPLTEQTNINFGVGANFGSRTYLRSNFGVPTGGTTTLAAFSPRAGVYSVDGGVEVISAISHRWVILGGFHVSQLQGDARRSPRTVDPLGYSASVGLAYRCCR